ncbi:MAG: thioredoxin family protein [Bacilli bacterium]|nr:thioredoxin family protein [Bacilli bacterium]
MTKTKYRNDSLPIKTWLIRLCIIVGVVFVALYCYKWYQVKSEEEYLNSYLVSTNTINMEMNDISEISNVLSETPSYYFIYISYVKDESVYNLEKELKPLIDDYDLHNNFYFINVTDIKEKNTNYINDIAKELNIEADKIKNVPVILYFKDGELVQDGAYSAKEFEQLLQNQDVRSM